MIAVTGGQRSFFAALVLGALAPGCSLVLETYRFGGDQADAAPVDDLAPPDAVVDDVPIADVIVPADQLPIELDGAALTDAASDAIGTADVPTSTTGHAWHVAPGAIGIDTTLNAVWAASSDEVYAGGANGRMLHRVGGSWQLEPLPDVPSDDGNTPAPMAVRAIWGNATDVWAACSFDGGGTALGAVMRRVRGDRTGAWRLFTRLGFRPRGIYTGWPGPSLGLIAGEDGAIYGFDANVPSIVLLLLPTGITPMNAIAGRDAEPVWFAGAYPIALRIETDALPLILVPDVGFSDSLEDVSVSQSHTPRTALVSDRGTLAVYEFGVWRFVPNASVNHPLHGVFTADDATVFGVGDEGTIVRSAHPAGAADTVDSPRYWWFDTSPTRQRLLDVHGVASNDAWAVGEHGTILRLGAD